MESQEVEVNGVKSIIYYPIEPSRTSLERLYDTYNELFKDKPECFYTSEEVKEMKENKTKVFLQ